MTKEELTKENVKLSIEYKALLKSEEEIKKEFAKGFGWYKKDFYSNTNDVRNPSWEEIFIKIGNLLSKEKYVEYSSEIHTLNEEIGRIIKDIEKIKINNN